MPTVIKYSSQPLEQPNRAQGSKNRLNDTPVVIKYLQEYTSPNSKDSSVSSSKSTQSQRGPEDKDVLFVNSRKSVESQAETDNNSTAAMPVTSSQKGHKTSFERHSQSKREVVVPEDKNVLGPEQPQASHDSKTPERRGLAQSTGEQVKISRGFAWSVSAQ